jgi:hypothetical protein
MRKWERDREISRGMRERERERERGGKEKKRKRGMQTDARKKLTCKFVLVFILL